MKHNNTAVFNSYNDSIYYFQHERVSKLVFGTLYSNFQTATNYEFSRPTHLQSTDTDRQICPQTYTTVQHLTTSYRDLHALYPLFTRGQTVQRGLTNQNDNFYTLYGKLHPTNSTKTRYTHVPQIYNVSDGLIRTD